MAVEKPGKLRDFFSYFVATLSRCYSFINSVSGYFLDFLICIKDSEAS